MSVRKKVDKILSYLLIAIMSVMVLNVLWQVFTRFVIGTPSSFTDELARYLMIWVGILGAAYAAGKDMHIAINVLTQKFNRETQQKLAAAVKLMVILFALTAMVIGGSRLVYVTYVLNQLSPALQIPLAYVYLVIPLSGLVIIYYKIMDILYPSF
ncbi:TRAP transporter small permease [Flagellimonas hymeniacidonis]|uniref:TRAP transporter small permease n=1 Tax=Flagellimonas hymeniacidonis TaxID=2603628 RepID=A0A5C8V204_9FLAO|nr:TRAP transporter small permease [Flagellimonas hymeniacidonis]TXN35620.1 TRAP transporter small permease [Flagellimonas hymeniacidonis]